MASLYEEGDDHGCALLHLAFSSATLVSQADQNIIGSIFNTVFDV